MVSVMSRGRDIFFYSDVDASSVLSLLMLLKDADESDQESPIRLFIHSGGGDVHSSLSVHDHIKGMSAPVHCIADGIVGSDAVLILLSGVQSFCMPNAFIRPNDVTKSMVGQYIFAEHESKSMNTVMERVLSVYDKLEIGRKKVYDILDSDILLDANESVSKKLVNDIFGT